VNPTGTFIAMGMPAPDARKRKGTVTVYKAMKDQYNQIGGDVKGEIAKAGFSAAVALTSYLMKTLTLIAGAKTKEEGNKSGYARVYTLVQKSGTGYVWVQRGHAIDREKQEKTGGAVSVSKSGQRIAVGSGGHDFYRGRVQVFDYDDTSNVWNQV